MFGVWHTPAPATPGSEGVVSGATVQSGRVLLKVDMVFYGCRSPWSWSTWSIGWVICAVRAARPASYGRHCFVTADREGRSRGRNVLCSKRGREYERDCTADLRALIHFTHGHLDGVKWEVRHVPETSDDAGPAAIFGLRLLTFELHPSSLPERQRCQEGQRDQAKDGS